MVVQRKKASDYKNHKVSWPKGGISLLSKRGAISATISGYLIVIGTFCWRKDFQYSLLNWYTCSISFLIILLSFKASGVGLDILSLIGNE